MSSSDGSSTPPPRSQEKNSENETDDPVKKDTDTEQSKSETVSAASGSGSGGSGYCSSHHKIDNVSKTHVFVKKMKCLPIEQMPSTSKAAALSALSVAPPAFHLQDSNINLNNDLSHLPMVENLPQNQVAILENVDPFLPKPPIQMNTDALLAILKQIITKLSADDAQTRASPEWKTHLAKELQLRPIVPLNALVDYAFIDHLWCEAVQEAFRGRHQETLKLFTGPYTVLAYRSLLKRHPQMAQEDRRFMMAADVEQTPLPPSPHRRAPPPSRRFLAQNRFVRNLFAPVAIQNLPAPAQNPPAPVPVAQNAVGVQHRRQFENLFGRIEGVQVVLAENAGDVANLLRRVERQPDPALEQYAVPMHLNPGPPQNHNQAEDRDAPNRNQAAKLLETNFDPTWLHHTDHIIVSQFHDISVWRLTGTLRFLFGGNAVRHLVISNYDLEPIPLLSSFDALQSVTFFELPASRSRQKALFAWLADPKSLPALEELHVIEEKEGIFCLLDLPTVAPLFRRLTSLSLVGYPEGQNLVPLLATLDPNKIRSIYLGKLKDGLFGVVRLSQQLLNLQYGLTFEENAEWEEVKKEIKKQRRLLPPAPEPLPLAPAPAAEGGNDNQPVAAQPRPLTAVLRHGNSFDKAKFHYSSEKEAKQANYRLYQLMQQNIASARAEFVRPDVMTESEDDEEEEEEEEEEEVMMANQNVFEEIPIARAEEPRLEMINDWHFENDLPLIINFPANPPPFRPEDPQRRRRLDLFQEAFQNLAISFDQTLQQVVEQELLTSTNRHAKVIWALSVPEAVNRLVFCDPVEDMKRPKKNKWKSEDNQNADKPLKKFAELKGEQTQNKTRKQVNKADDNKEIADRLLTEKECHALRILLKWIARTARRVTRQVVLGRRKVASVEERITRVENRRNEGQNDNEDDIGVQREGAFDAVLVVPGNRIVVRRGRDRDRNEQRNLHNRGFEENADAMRLIQRRLQFARLRRRLAVAAREERGGEGEDEGEGGERRRRRLAARRIFQRRNGGGDGDDQLLVAPFFDENVEPDFLNDVQVVDD